MIKRVGPGKYKVMDRTGKKPLSKPMPRAAAVRRLRQVEAMKASDKPSAY